MRHRLGAAAPILVSVIGLVLLPIAVNVASGYLPASWHRYLWLGWPSAALLAALLVAVELRRTRKANVEPGSADDVVKGRDPSAAKANTLVRANPSVVFHVEAGRDAYTAEQISVVQHGGDNRHVEENT